MQTHSTASCLNLIPPCNLVLMSARKHKKKTHGYFFSAGIHLLQTFTRSYKPLGAHTPVPPCRSHGRSARAHGNGHVDTKTNELMQVYTNELMRRAEEDGHGSCTSAHWQNLTNVPGRTRPTGLLSRRPPLLPLPSLSAREGRRWQHCTGRPPLPAKHCRLRKQGPPPSANAHTAGLAVRVPRLSQHPVRHSNTRAKLSVNNTPVTEVLSRHTTRARLQAPYMCC